MRWRSAILTSLLLVLSIALLVAGAPEFVNQTHSSVNINPQDSGILVHEVSVHGGAEPVRIKELTVKNFGNASENELEEVEVRYRRNGSGWKTVTLEDLSGIRSGITFTLPGEGMTLYPDQEGRFQFRTTVASPERIPITRYGKDVTAELGSRYHFVYLEDTSRAVESVSSNFVVDPAPDELVRGGFEEVSSLSLRNEILQPGTTSTIARAEFKDVDANESGVKVDLITLTNRYDRDDPLILGQDITEVQLKLMIEEDGERRKKSITKSITSPTSEVTFSTSQDSWWDGRCRDGCRVTMEIMGTVASSGTSQGMKLRTRVRLETKETNGMAGYPFNQESVVSVDDVQSIVKQRLEGIEETTEWKSGVINQGRTYRQRLVLNDSDMDSDDFTLNSIRLANEGSLSNSRVDGLSVYRVSAEGELLELGTGLNLVSEWQELDSSHGRIRDDGRATLEIHYDIADEAKRGTTFKPVVQFQGREGVAGNAKSPVYESPRTLTVYPWGAEIAEVGKRSGRVPNVGEGSILAQRIDVMEKDENRYDLLINPIVIRNQGTASGSEFRKLELYDADGNLLATETDLSGLSKAGVTLGNLDGKTTVPNSQVGSWRTFFVFLTPKPTPGRKTVNLETTLYQTEGSKDVITTLEGPDFTVGRVEGAPRRAEPPERAPPEAEPEADFGVGFAAGLSYPNLFAFNAKFFLDYLIGDSELGGLGGDTFARIGIDADSLEDYGYLYPNASFGYRWPAQEGIHQFAGIGGGPIYINDDDNTSDFAVHGLFGITTTNAFEEDIPVTLQAKYKFLSGDVSQSVLEISLGFLYR